MMLKKIKNRNNNRKLKKELLIIFLCSVFLIGCGYGAIKRSKEGQTKGNLGAIRSAISIYYGDNEGVWPDDLTTEEFRNYIMPIPPERITNSNKISKIFDGTGGWYYNSRNGEIKVNLNGVDSRGFSFMDY